MHTHTHSYFKAIYTRSLLLQRVTTAFLLTLGKDNRRQGNNSTQEEGEKEKGHSYFTAIHITDNLYFHTSLLLYIVTLGMGSLSEWSATGHNLLKIYTSQSSEGMQGDRRHALGLPRTYAKTDTSSEQGENVRRQGN